MPPKPHRLSSASDAVNVDALADLAGLERASVDLGGVETSPRAGLDEERRCDAPWISDESGASWHECAIEYRRQQLGVLLLVQDVGRKREIEATDIGRWMPPVEQPRARLTAQIRERIGPGKVERVFVVIG